MDAEIEVLDGVVEADGELVRARRPGAGIRSRMRAALTDPRLQSGAAATAGVVVGAATVALLRRAGATPATPALGRPVGPSQATWPGGPTIGPIAPGTYIVRVRAITLPPGP